MKTRYNSSFFGPHFTCKLSYYYVCIFPIIRTIFIYIYIFIFLPMETKKIVLAQNSKPVLGSVGIGSFSLNSFAHCIGEALDPRSPWIHHPWDLNSWDGNANFFLSLEVPCPLSTFLTFTITHCWWTRTGYWKNQIQFYTILPFLIYSTMYDIEECSLRGS
jgi:hypothetical protein